MIIILQSTDTERLAKEEGYGREAWIFLEGRNRIDYVAGLPVRENGSKRDAVVRGMEG